MIIWSLHMFWPAIWFCFVKGIISWEQLPVHRTHMPVSLESTSVAHKQYEVHLSFLYLKSQDPILNLSHSVMLYILSLQHMLWLKSWAVKYVAVMIFIHHSQQLWCCQGTAFIELNLKSLWLNIPSSADTVQLWRLWVAANSSPLMF